jgi:uncharacterized protein involved in exopolysaccharide biosynthesis
MQMRVIICLLFSFFCLASCGPPKKTIVAEIISSGNDNGDIDSKADSLEAIRLKKLIVNKELLELSIYRSKFPHSFKEVKESLSLEIPENTTIIQVRYTTADTTGATAFLDTLLLDLEIFDIAPALKKNEADIRYAQFRQDSMDKIFEHLRNFPDSNAAKKREEAYIEILQRKASLIIGRAGIISNVRIISWPHLEYR